MGLEVMSVTTDNGGSLGGDGSGGPAQVVVIFMVDYH